MLNESDLRLQLESVWKSEATPTERAKAFLKLSQRAKALGHKRMELGFAKHREGDIEHSRKLWAEAESMLSLSETARKDAQIALSGLEPPPAFDYPPCDLSVPPWERVEEPEAPLTRT